MNATRTSLAHDLGLAVEGRGYGITIVVDCDLIKTGLFEIHRTARRRDFKQIT